MKTTTVLLIFLASFALIALSLSTSPAQDGPTPAWVLDAGPEAAPAPAAPEAAPGAPVVVVPEEPGEALSLLGRVLQAAKGGQWSLVFVLGILLAVYVLRVLAGKWSKLAWFTTKWGGWALVVGGTAAATIAATLANGGAISWSLVSQAVTLALAAAAAHELHKDSPLK